MVAVAGFVAFVQPTGFASSTEPPDAEGQGLVLVAAVALGLAVALLVGFALLRRLLFVCRPNELLVVSGKNHRLPSGEIANYTVIQAGSHWRIPFLQSVARMDIRLVPIELSVTKVLSHGGIPLDVHAIANIKITSEPKFIYNAVERFLTLDPGAIYMTAKQTLEGALRDIISQLTPEQVNEDRIAFANRLLETTNEVFDKLGLHLDTLKIQRVEDEAQYLVNIARTQIANAVRDAENAENQANQEFQQEEAAARQAAELAQKQAAIGVAQKRNELRALVGQLEGEAQAVEREAKVAAEQARAEAEQELQAVRKELEIKRLQCEVVLPAEAQRKAGELLAQGAAAQQREQGVAAAEAMRAMSEALTTAGPQAREMFVLSQLDGLVGQVASRVKNVAIGEVQVVDGGDGRSLPAVAASYPAIVMTVFSTLRDLMGVDLQSMLASQGGER
ncbi:MAG TPA: SPFH domain-containing protein [Polyangiaceae bacterium]|nr:SPFH domain-containing protein [Polyangiaceae bacterium]